VNGASLSRAKLSVGIHKLILPLWPQHYKPAESNRSASPALLLCDSEQYVVLARQPRKGSGDISQNASQLRRDALLSVKAR
jgi:hypothetical protein